MPDPINMTRPLIRLSRNTPEEIISARRTCAEYAADLDDLRQLLTALGLDR